jgi:hypothetical protein
LQHDFAAPLRAGGNYLFREHVSAGKAHDSAHDLCAADIETDYVHRHPLGAPHSACASFKTAAKALEPASGTVLD